MQAAAFDLNAAALFSETDRKVTARWMFDGWRFSRDATGHAPWLLIEAGIIKDRKVTSFNSIKTDVISAGGNWEGLAGRHGQGLVMSRNPGDLMRLPQKLLKKRQKASTRSADSRDSMSIRTKGRHWRPPFIFESQVYDALHHNVRDLTASEL